MNRAEAAVDRLDPRLSVRLRLVKKVVQRDLVLAIIRALVRPGDVVLDIGANRGVYTRTLARLVGPSGRVHSFDPVPVNVSSLEALRRAHPNVVVHPVAVSDATGAGEIHVPFAGRGPVDALARLGDPPPGRHDTLPVTLVTIDDLFAVDDPAPAFVKCDVEGHEAAVLRGGRRVFASHLPALVVEIEQRHRHDDIRTTIDELLGWGYDGYTLAGRRVAPIADFDVARDQLRHLDDWAPGARAPSGYRGNFLFVRPGTPLGHLGPKGGP